MTYVLENAKEAARLERQSQSELYDPIAELDGFDIRAGQLVLDAGCGSGIVARAIAARHPGASVVGVDASEARVAEAKRLATDASGVEFHASNLTQPLDRQFDRIVCRFVLEHLDASSQTSVVQNLANALKPGGRLRLIDIDGYLFNIFPQPALIAECLAAFALLKGADLFVGRKLARHLVDAGLQDLSWRIQTMTMNEPAVMKEEATLIAERFEHTLPMMAQVLGSEEKARSFQKQYLELLKTPGTTLFYNKFIATAQKNPVARPKLKMA